MWKWKLKKSKFFPLVKCSEKTLLGNWGTISQDGLMIKRGYSWDGCSPKFKIFGITFGTWDGRNDCLKYPSLVHDILCQFPNPLERAEIDKIFYEMMKKVDFSFAKLYYYAVRCYSVTMRRK